MENDIVQYRFLVFGFSWQIVAEKFSFCKGWTPVFLEENNKTIDRIEDWTKIHWESQFIPVFTDRPLHFWKGLLFNVRLIVQEFFSISHCSFCLRFVPCVCTLFCRLLRKNFCLRSSVLSRLPLAPLHHERMLLSISYLINNQMDSSFLIFIFCTQIRFCYEIKQ